MNTGPEPVVKQEVLEPVFRPDLSPVQFPLRLAWLRANETLEGLSAPRGPSGGPPDAQGIKDGDALTGGVNVPVGQAVGDVSMSLQTLSVCRLSLHTIDKTIERFAYS